MEMPHNSISDAEPLWIIITVCQIVNQGAVSYNPHTESNRSHR
jgi:hypothetical protein